MEGTASAQMGPSREGAFMSAAQNAMVAPDNTERNNCMGIWNRKEGDSVEIGEGREWRENVFSRG